MVKSLENRLDDLIHEMSEMKKQIILDKSFKVDAAQSRIREWKALAKRVSAKWNGPSAVEEIRQQRKRYGKESNIGQFRNCSLSFRKGAPS